MKQQNFIKGKTGEDIAAEYLQKKNFTIIQKNFKTKFGEIDLVASKDNVLVFVEVKLKVGDNFGTPEEMINYKKLQQVQNTAISFLQTNPKIDKAHKSYRIDAVCIVITPQNEIVRREHYENVSF